MNTCIQIELAEGGQNGITSVGSPEHSSVQLSNSGVIMMEKMGLLDFSFSGSEWDLPLAEDDI